MNRWAIINRPSGTHVLTAGLCETEMGRTDRRLRLFETNYGRLAGWRVEKDGRCIARLTYLGNGDQFWDKYQVHFTTNDQTELDWLLNEHDPNVWSHRNLRFRNEELGEVAPYPFGGILEKGPDRCVVLMRGLYIPPPGLRFAWPWEWLLLRIRKRGIYAPDYLTRYEHGFTKTESGLSK